LRSRNKLAGETAFRDIYRFLDDYRGWRLFLTQNMLASRFLQLLRNLLFDGMSSVPAIEDIEYLIDRIVRVLLELGDGLL
jgi:hypothetical protein